MFKQQCAFPEKFVILALLRQGVYQHPLEWSQRDLRQFLAAVSERKISIRA
jgi:hypothetical protein